MIADPGEFNDLAKDAASTEVLREMREKLLDVFLQTGPRAQDIPDGLTAEEALQWFLEPPEESLPPAGFVNAE